MANTTFVIYIDEAGDEGFSFEKGSSKWFLLSAVIVRKTEELQTVKLVDKVRDTYRKSPKRPLHFRDLSHMQRLFYVTEIANAQLKTATVLTYKPSIRDVEMFREGYRLYFFLTRLLLGLVSKYCQGTCNAQEEGDGSAQIIFSNRSRMSYKEMRKYLNILKKGWSCKTRIDWSIVKPSQIMAYTPDKRMGLQIADAVAGSWYQSVEPNRGFTEERYAKILKPTVCQRSGNYLGNGVRFWPEETIGLLETDPTLQWVIQEYK